MGSGWDAIGRGPVEQTKWEPKVLNPGGWWETQGEPEMTIAQCLPGREGPVQRQYGGHVYERFGLGVACH